ncbi:MAG: hypothetical protein GY749_36830, partial [Desulfobacteraceae bacterium]|nr:hypothetical protein [Desulfobacteraceae bacterium]
PPEIDLPVFGFNFDSIFGYKRHCSVIEGFVWEDADADGIMNGENGIPNVTVDLVSAGDDGTVGTGDDFLVGTQTTDEYGYYTFTDLRNGIYRVYVTDTNSVLNWHVNTFEPVPPEIDLPVFGFNFDSIFGYKRHDSVIGGIVWDDMNGDGIKDIGEDGISEVTVDLVSAGADGIFDTGDEFLVGTQTTQEDGTYSFMNLQDGVYQVNVTDINLVLDGFVQTTGTEPLIITLAAFQQSGDANLGYRLETGSAAELSDPAPGSELSSTSVTFTWNDTGTDHYWLWIGTTGTGSKDIYSDGQGTNTSKMISGLPDSGETLYVRLHSQADGEWFYNDYTYTASASTAAEIQTPVPGTSLSSVTATFVWSNAGTEQYWLWIGTSEGSNDIYSDDQGTNNTKLITGLPDDGETLYVRLMSKTDGEWIYNDYTYTAFSAAASVIQTPTPGSSLSSTTATFTWSDAGAAQYWLWIGTSQGDKDVYSDDQGTSNAKLITGLPSGGETLYVRLWSNFNGEWVFNDYTYTAYSVASAEILTPVPGSTLNSAGETFTWSDAGAEQYWLWIGTSPGGKDVYSDGRIHELGD